MQPIDASFMYKMGSEIHPIADVKAESILGDILLPILIAESALEQLLTASVFRLRTSYADGMSLLTTLKAVKDKTIGGDLKTKIDWNDFYNITSTLARFEAVLAAEMRVGSCYMVSQQKALDTAAVILDGSVAFPTGLMEKVAAALPDTRDAMKCIVFELPTAAGFHLHRANESVLAAYYEAVTQGAPPPKLKTIGEYLKEMDNRKVGDPKVKAALRDLKDLHRNPLIHPDQRLETVDEAYALYCGVFAAMEPMLKAIPLPAPASQLAQMFALPPASQPPSGGP